MLDHLSSSCESILATDSFFSSETLLLTCNSFTELLSLPLKKILNHLLICISGNSHLCFLNTGYCSFNREYGTNNRDIT